MQFSVCPQISIARFGSARCKGKREREIGRGVFFCLASFFWTLPTGLVWISLSIRLKDFRTQVRKLPISNEPTVERSTYSDAYGCRPAWWLRQNRWRYTFVSGVNVRRRLRGQWKLLFWSLVPDFGCQWTLLNYAVPFILGSSFSTIFYLKTNIRFLIFDMNIIKFKVKIVMTSF